MPSDAKRIDHTHLPPSTEGDIRAMALRAGLNLTEDLMQQLIAAWPAYEQMVRRIPRSRAYEAEPAHIFKPTRLP
jgi:hypothetical protein